jgi:hypothetical protein
MTDDSSSSTSTLTTDENSYTALKIRELEHQLQLKDAEINRLRNEFEIKIQEIKIQHKDEIISMLKQTHTQQTILKINERENISEKQEKPKLTTKEYLDKYLNDASTFKNCYEMFNDEKLDNYVVEFQNFKMIKYVLNKKYIHSSDFKNNAIKNALDIITNYFKNFNENEMPFYCSDKRRNTLYIKTDNGWIKETPETQKEFDYHILKFIKRVLYSVRNALGGTKTNYEDHPTKFMDTYNINYFDWVKNNYNEIIGVLSLMDNSSGKSKSNKETDNENLAIKKVKHELSQMSKKVSNCEEDI